jgi:hypothetical protein
MYKGEQETHASNMPGLGGGSGGGTKYGILEGKLTTTDEIQGPSKFFQFHSSWFIQNVGAVAITFATIIAAWLGVGIFATQDIAFILGEGLIGSLVYAGAEAYSQGNLEVFVGAMMKAAVSIFSGLIAAGLSFWQLLALGIGGVGYILASPARVAMGLIVNTVMTTSLFAQIGIAWTQYNQP